MTTQTFISRRAFLGSGALAGGGIWLAGCARKTGGDSGNGISPIEDLMREHGVLKRVLLVYREAALRLSGGLEDLPAEPLRDSIRIMQDFIERYHELLEEEFLFPRFRTAGRHVDLVDTLTRQHAAGRRLTDLTLRLLESSEAKNEAWRSHLSAALTAFSRMYEPHEAREDTVLFPAFRLIVGRNEYADLGERFEEREHALFGGTGFEDMVGRVAATEKSFGIHDLNQFTQALS